MRITFITHDIHFGGGGEKVTIELANYLAEKSNAITILSVSTPKRENKFKINERVRVRYLNVDLNQGNKFLRKTISVLEVRKYFRKERKEDFVIGIGNYPSLLTTLITRRKRQIKVGWQVSSYASVTGIWVYLRRFLFGRLNAIISVTEQDKIKYLKFVPKVFVIPNSVSFYPGKAAELINKTILSVGRIDHLKGYDLMIEAFDRFCEFNKEWKLKIIGVGPLSENILNHIHHRGLTEKVSVIPKVDDITDEYLNASVFLMTSRSEGMPVVLLEAMASGLPVIAFDCETGPAEIISNGRDGYLIENFNTEKMCSKLLELCSDMNKRREFGMCGRENCKEFFQEKIYVKWEKLFEDLTTF